MKISLLGLALPRPTVSGISPTTASVGGTVTVTGTGFLAGALAYVNDRPQATTVASRTSLSFVVASGSTTGAVSVRTQKGAAVGPTLTVS